MASGEKTQLWMIYLSSMVIVCMYINVYWRISKKSCVPEQDKIPPTDFIGWMK